MGDSGQMSGLKAISDLQCYYFISPLTFHSIYIKIGQLVGSHQAFGSYLNTEKCGEVLEITEKGEILQFKGYRHLSFEVKYH